MKPRFSPSCDRSWVKMADRFTSRRYSFKNKLSDRITRWQNIVIRHYVADLLATDKSRYFAQPCPIIANYSYFWKNIGPVGYNLRPRAIHATSCV